MYLKLHIYECKQSDSSYPIEKSVHLAFTNWNCTLTFPGSFLFFLCETFVFWCVCVCVCILPGDFPSSFSFRRMLAHSLRDLMFHCSLRQHCILYFVTYKVVTTDKCVGWILGCKDNSLSHSGSSPHPVDSRGCNTSSWSGLHLICYETGYT